MIKSKIWVSAFFLLLTTNIAGLIYYSTRNKSQDILYLKSENHDLKEDYLKNAKELKYMIETFLNNSNELKKYMPEYQNRSDKEFEEGLRKRAVKLDLKIEELEKE